MSLIKYLNKRDGLFDSMIDRLFQDDFFTFFIPARSVSGVPVETEETDTHFVVRADVPGVSKDNLNIEVDGDIMTISGEKKCEKKDESKTGYYTERFYGKFSRTIRLPADIDSEKVEASYDNGVIEIKIPKTEKSKAKKIEIK